MAALLDRADTEKGAKDAREILALLEEGIDPQRAIQVLIDATAGPVSAVPGHTSDAFDRLAERGGDRGGRPNKSRRSRLHQLKREWVEFAQRAIDAVDQPQSRPRFSSEFDRA